jgi:hypothetical protein
MPHELAGTVMAALAGHALAAWLPAWICTPASDAYDGAVAQAGNGTRAGLRARVRHDAARARACQAGGRQPDPAALYREGGYARRPREAAVIAQKVRR